MVFFVYSYFYWITSVHPFFIVSIFFDFSIKDFMGSLLLDFFDYIRLSVGFKKIPLDVRRGEDK